MAQTAHNGWIELPADTWVKISEVNCTFVVEEGPVQIIGTDGTAPAADALGITYRTGEGEDVSTGMLARFVGAGTADGLYAISRGRKGWVFVSRAAVA
jgi:hypothetical protein